MSKRATFRLLILHEHEVRRAGIALAAMRQALKDKAPDDTIRALHIQAMTACEVALWGMTDTAVLMLLNARDWQACTSAMMPKVKGRRA